MSHTPGPWIAIKRNVLLKSDQAQRICVCQKQSWGLYKITMSEAEANARLIAAAPELLEALNDMILEMSEQDLLGYLDENSMSFKSLAMRIKRAELAVKKAKG